MTSQMLFVQMLLQVLVIIQVKFAEIAPRMWKNLNSILASNISFINMISDSLQVVELLLSNEYQPSFETDFAEASGMLFLHVSLKRLVIGELLVVFAVLVATLSES